MSGLLLLGVVALVAVVGAILRPARTSGPVSPSQAWVAAAGHAGRVSGSAWTLLVAVPLLVSVAVVPTLRGLTTGVAVGLLPTVGGVAFLAVHAVGELTWPRPT